MKIVVSHPTGNAFVRSAATALLEADMLSEFNTTIATFPGGLFDRLSGFGSFAEFRRRRYDITLKPFTRTSPWFELGRQFASKSGIKGLIRHETGIFSVDAVYKNLDKQVASRLKRNSLPGVTGVYAYEDGALFSFRAAKAKNIQCLYDLPIGYWRAAHKYLDAERHRWPDWVSTLTGLEDSAYKLRAKDEEISMADRIIVASSFTAQTLQVFPGTLPPIDIIPYAFPPVVHDRSYSVIRDHQKIKLLFVGGLSQRKGIADLFTVVESLKDHVELTVVGLKLNNDCEALNKSLKKHRWIPTLPHAGILKLMQEHDVLVFPSLFEGFGLVISEAMSQGTPVITTDRTAGPDIINHGHNGWLIEAGSTQNLQAAIEELIRNPHLIQEAGKAAMESARSRSWRTYESELTTAIENHFSTIGIQKN